MPLKEFPDVPAYPDSLLKSRDPEDLSKPAATCFYDVPSINWVRVRKFYLKWMVEPEFGWKAEPPPGGDQKDPHLYFSKGDTMVAVNPRSYAEQGQYVVFKYQRLGSAPAPTPTP